MNALDTPALLVHQPGCHSGELDSPSRFSVDSCSVGRLLARLHTSFVEDEELDDVLNAVLDPGTALSMDEIERLAPRLRKMLGQLVSIATQRNTFYSAYELAGVVGRVRQLGDPAPGGLGSARGQLRLLALAVLDVLELVSDDDRHSASGSAALGGVRP
ncbi:DUF6415 family natural product biosynthesis protein [Streptomyces sp. IB2014 016-6]|uniref:DUF6415 family natural product biosynthesis protein n=1 Tax=Streptomyces sp. IB2014 016-6 TaxID=2517818 RepID=UPI0011CA0AB0|nr:DUF6415 family natural product biosynthesis protein [Streptomyces sp. IB2014 016-6]TXL91855.1 hypothetical protein EW053_06100 [Streptomyces sp. IB2014 016-6]